MKKRFYIITFIIVLLSDYKAQESLIVAETMPSYRGGVKELHKYLQTNLRYPKEALENAYFGRSIIQFIVDTSGKVQNPQIIRSSGHKVLDEEAIRSVGKMQNWNVGYDAVKAVNVNVNLSITFAINSSLEEFNPEGLFLPKKIKDSAIITKEEKDSLSAANKANYYYYQGIGLADSEKLNAALEKFDKSLEYMPLFKDALYNKAVMHYNLKEVSKACESWQKIQSLYMDKEVDVLITKYCSQK